MDRRQRHDSKRRVEQPWRALYKTPQWLAIRAEQLAFEPLCRMCRSQGRIVEATVCDHVEPHHGDPEKFFRGPFQSLCVTHHDGAKKRQEQRGYVVGTDTNGRPLDPAHPWNRK